MVLRIAAGLGKKRFAGRRQWLHVRHREADSDGRCNELEPAQPLTQQADEVSIAPTRFSERNIHDRRRDCLASPLVLELEL